MKTLHPSRPSVTQRIETQPWNSGTSLTEIHCRSDGTYTTPSHSKVKRSQSMSRLSSAPKSGVSASTQRSISAQRSTIAGGLDSRKSQSNLSERKRFVPGGTSLGRSQSMKNLGGAPSQRQPISRNFSFNSRKDNKLPNTHLNEKNRNIGMKNKPGAYSTNGTLKSGVKRQAISKPDIKSKCPRKSILKLPTETPGKDMMGHTDTVDGAKDGEKPGSQMEQLGTGDQVENNHIEILRQTAKSVHFISPCVTPKVNSAFGRSLTNTVGTPPPKEQSMRCVTLC